MLKSFLHNFFSFIGIYVVLLIACLIELCLWTAFMNAPPFTYISIYFYRGLISLGASFFPLVFILARIRFGRLMSSLLHTRDIMLISITACALTLAFFSLGPVVIDRSNSILVLRNLEAHTTPATKQQMQDEFVQSYIRDLDQIGRRITEQLTSGTITEQNGGYILTPKGQLFLRVARFLSPIFNTDPRFVAPIPPAPAR